MTASPVRARASACALLTCLAVVLAACGSDGTKPLGAAEPATAPPTSAAAVGSTARVGTEPEGIVYDPRSKLVAVAVRDPDRLQLLDPDTLQVRRTVRLPGSVRHLQLSVTGDEVLVPAESANQIVEVPLPTGPVRATEVLKQPHDATRAADGDVVVGNEFGKSISIVRDGRVLKTIADLKQPGGVIADGTTIGVVDVGAFTLATYDLDTLRRTAVIAAGKGPTARCARRAEPDCSSRTPAAISYCCSASTRCGGSPGWRCPGRPYGMAVDHTTGTVWVTLTARNQVVGLHVSATGCPRRRPLRHGCGSRTPSPSTPAATGSGSPAPTPAWSS